MKRIIIADDHAVVRTGIQLIMADSRDMVLARECSTGGELMRILKAESFDLLILDLHLPENEGGDLIVRIKKLYPKLPVVIFTMDTDDHIMIHKLQQGAAAFVSKETSPDKIVDILHEVFRTKRYITVDQSKKLMNFALDPDSGKDSVKLLTAREFQILKAIASGYSYDRIAEELKLSKNTIANHRAKMLHKLHLKNNTDLTRFAIKQEIIK